METTDRLLKPCEVARLFRVDSKTVQNWAHEGKIFRMQTLGGHGRYRESEVRRLLAEQGVSSADADTMVASVLPT